MDTFTIQGGNKLSGSISVMGAKNAAGPLIAATTLIAADCIIHNMPRISDIEMMTEILVGMGAIVSWPDRQTLKINCAKIDPGKIDHDKVAKIRLSILFLGCLAQRFNKIKISVPGGCSIGSRPLDAHFEALRDLGYRCDIKDDCYSIEKKTAAKNAITMKEFSVTATENAILAAVLSDSKLKINCAAAEHVVQDLSWFLNTAGAKISGIGTHQLEIQGVKSLKATEYTLMPDPIETGTFIVLAAATHSKLKILDAAPEFLAMELRKFQEVGLTIDLEDVKPSTNGHYQLATIIPHYHQSIQAVKKLHCMPYPGFGADLIQPFALLMTQAQGTSIMHDWMFDGRLRYVSELKKMGANINILDPHRILIVGPTPLYGKEIISYDIRAGATLVIAALIAEGKTLIHGIDQVDRGYQNLDKRLKNLGADIVRS
jgi:UDP-N-acetylglucosamine 1-carboxyvinyltransferase